MIKERHIIGFLIVMHMAGLVGLTTSWSRDWFERLIPFNLMASASIVLFLHKSWNRRFLLVAISVYLIGFIIEMIGVQSGWVFGNYHYGPNLGWKIKGTPLLIGLNWLMLTYCIWSMLQLITNSRVTRILMLSAAMVLLDFFIEPVAVQTKMWAWESSHIPIQNYVAWGVISSGIGFIWSLLPDWKKNPVAASLYPIQLFFFILLGLLI